MNGYEKISDELKRQEKVNRLKSKILSDINKKIDVCKRELHSDTTSDEDYSFWVYRYFYLLELKKYIEDIQPKFLLNFQMEHLNDIKSKERTKLYELQNKCKWYTDFWQ